MLRPRVTLKRRWNLIEVEAPQVSANIELGLLGDLHDLTEAWMTLSGQLAHAHRALFGAVTGHLEEAAAIDRAASNSDGFDRLSFDRSAIEPHEQDRHPDDWEFLVDVARDVLEWLLGHEPGLGVTAIDLWERSDSRVLQRLAIHGWSKRADMAPQAVLQHISESGWLFGLGLKHEVFMLLKVAFPAAPADAQARFIEYSSTASVLDETAVREGTDVDRLSSYERYNVAAWLKEIAPESELAQSHFAALQEKHQDFVVREHLTFDHYIGAAWRGEPPSRRFGLRGVTLLRNDD